MNQESLAAHGQWKFAVENNLMMLTISGSFNAQGIQLMHKSIALQLADQRYIPDKAYVDAGHWALSTPDSEDAVRHLHARMKQIGLRRVAYAIANVHIRKTVLEQLWQAHPEVKRGYFSTPQEALNWLNNDNQCDLTG
ncbi:STAS/SEC14 domain-containing protein [Corallincola spongiicola]|uniref:STAS/SEC14 domain-containing protein n=1 Tax=Corallincola spongiicola TaxID=2520508 RepID=A0ABY1WN57_9GAMM|nr:STAS/SEC14 domain-containing protein [Corallincola spongiicola]TAA44989.1 hypothetical protein EXY25_12310 [Corallincola spongiicola]